MVTGIKLNVFAISINSSTYWPFGSVHRCSDGWWQTFIRIISINNYDASIDSRSSIIGKDDAEVMF